MIMSHVDLEYGKLIRKIMDKGDDIKARNGEVKRIVGHEVVFDSTPLVSLRKTAWLSALREMEWFMSGSNNINDLHENVRGWWRPWENANGEISYNYGYQFRSYQGWFDQIQFLVEGIKHHPFSRRNLVTTWNPIDMNSSGCLITNCHGTLLQAFIDQDDKLDLIMVQRSVDTIVGLPCNWIQYWSLLLWLAKETDKKIGKLHWYGMDVHLYSVHKDIILGILILHEDNVYQKIKTPPMEYIGKKGDKFRADNF